MLARLAGGPACRRPLHGRSKCRSSYPPRAGHRPKTPQLVPAARRFVEWRGGSAAFPRVADHRTPMSHSPLTPPLEGALVQSVTLVDRLSRTVPGTFRVGSLPRPSAAPGRRRRSHARGQRPHPAANAGNGRVVLRRRGGNGAYSPGALDLLHRQLSGAAAIAAPRFPARVARRSAGHVLFRGTARGLARHRASCRWCATCGFSRG